jgi:TolB-like protein/class 3 adenylate cyclase
VEKKPWLREAGESMTRDQRRLTAIVSADVVGYARLMGRDEGGTLAALKAHLRELIDPKIAEYAGRTVKSMADGMLLEFPSVVDAVRCAVDVQRGMVERNADVPDDRQIRFRIGINVGDIIIDGDDIFGDGVNVAARLQALAEPDGICVSASVREQIRSDLGVLFEDIGEQELKNIERPIRAFAVRLGDPSSALAGFSVTAPVRGFGGRPAIAVLPFDNMSDDPEQAYFADGIAEDILTRLAMWRWMPVIARNSSFAYRGKAIDLKQVGKALGARYILEGSVRKSGDRVRISGQLIDTETGHHVWAQRYDRVLTDIFAVRH